jgi:hypothetical protein
VRAAAQAIARLAVAILATGAAAAQPVVTEGLGSIFDPDFPIVVADFDQVTGPVDTRFFGDFCQPEPKEFCKSVPVLPDPCTTLRDTRVHIDHLTTHRGGVLQGSGTFVLGGKRGDLVLAGAVLDPDSGILGLLLPGPKARVVAFSPGLDERRGIATLSPSGVLMTAFLDGRSVVLRKDACGNTAPTVSVTATGGPTFPFSSSIQLVGHITDEDTSFPEERLVFRSDRQGVLFGHRDGGGRTLSISTLQPGNHHITLTVTDSGGLSSQGSVDITVVNRPPSTPNIFLPAEGATLEADTPVLLSGNAADPDTGFLTGGALRWSAQFVAGGPFVPLGSGNEVGTAFATPVDPLRIRLTATDSGGQTSFAEHVVRVVTGDGNAPPVAVIRQPDRLQVNGSPVAGFFSFQPASFVGTAFDREDAEGDLDVVWEFVAISGVGGAEIASPPVPNPAPIAGTLAPVVSFDPNANSFYRVTLRVTDSGGKTSSDSIEVYLQSSPIL